jgi:hypothetical protein
VFIATNGLYEVEADGGSVIRIGKDGFGTRIAVTPE